MSARPRAASKPLSSPHATRPSAGGQSATSTAEGNGSVSALLSVRLNSLQASEASLRKQLDARGAKVAELERSGAQLRQELDDSRARAHQLERALGAEQNLRQELEANELRIAELEAIEAELGAEIAERDTRLSELEKGQPAADDEKATELRERLAQRELQLSELRFTETELQEALQQREAHLREAEARLAERETRVAQLDAALSELERQLAERDNSLREAETALARSRSEALGLKPKLDPMDQPDGAPGSDDLKVLRGIGPSFEKALHQAGIHTLEQIAAWAPEDITRVAEQIGTNPRRILRNDWVGGAQNEVRRRKKSRE